MINDIEGLQQLLKDLGIESPKIIYRSINKALTGVRTDAVNAVYQQLNLTKTRIRKDFDAPVKAHAGKLRGSIAARGKPVGLMSFGAKQLKNGTISVKVLRGGSKKKLKHSFIATAKGAENVWWRKTIYKRPVKPGVNYAKLPKKYRLPVELRSGPRIEDILAKSAVYSDVELKGWTRLRAEYARLLRIELNRH